MTSNQYLTIVINTPTADVQPQQSAIWTELPDDPAHPTFDGAVRHVTDGRRFQLHHDARGEFEDVTATAVYVADGLTGHVVELGPWSLSPQEANQLGSALSELAAALDSRFA